MKTDSLKRLAVLGLTSEQMSVVLDVLAVELAPMERTRELAAKRQQRYVERNTNVRLTSLAQRQDDVAVTPLAPVVDNISKPSLLVEESKKDSPPSPSKPTSTDPEGFKEFWEVYPKRAGAADRKAAVKAFGPALKRSDLKTLLWAAGRYAADCKATGKVGTEFVKQARTWLNVDAWTEYGEVTTEGAAVNLQSYYTQPGTPEWDLWEPYWVKTKGHKPPRDLRGGWSFPSRYPPTHTEQAA